MGLGAEEVPLTKSQHTLGNEKNNEKGARNLKF
jgi:hypothetical protein